jgi:hypothetical protein
MKTKTPEGATMCKCFSSTATVFLVTLMVGLNGMNVDAATLKSKTVEAWEHYVQLTEERIARELDSDEGYFVVDFLPSEQVDDCREKLAAGEICVLDMSATGEGGEEAEIPSGMVHHWLGSLFVPNVSLDELMTWVKSYDEHERYFEEVEASELLSKDGDVYDILLRLKRKKIVTVHYNTEHRVEYRQHDPLRVSSKSHTTRIAQIENPGTSSERERPEGRDSGFLWRLNSYWRYKEVGGGVLVELETLSLSRGIPAAVKWLVAGYVNSVPRESLQSTLTSIRDGVTETAIARKGVAGRPTAPGNLSN